MREKDLRHSGVQLVEVVEAQDDAVGNIRVGQPEIARNHDPHPRPAALAVGYEDIVRTFELPIVFPTAPPSLEVVRPVLG